MTIDGQFVSPPRIPVSSRILLWAIIAAVLAGGVFAAAIALWLALSILPIALGAGVLAYAMYRYRLWRSGQALGHRRDLWRP